ncbi:uncharacterized protein OCT59_008495 [Rhizophagus irregularis]|uniref:uncharacterized protein n=1 Tax=Rhizophagus irregularis TaxID=588596 RepID=UPI00331BBA11|nr:hypothetical protein OCT59_008495 [Rhizophagus irregularis]
MEQCWDADPSRRPDIETLTIKIQEMNLYYQKPRNATEEELEAFHSKSYDFNIPNDIDDINKSSNQDNSKTSKISSIFKANSKKLSKIFEKFQMKNKTTQQIKGPNIVNFNDEDEIYNNPNLHSEEQNELEIPDDV